MISEWLVSALGSPRIRGAVALAVACVVGVIVVAAVVGHTTTTPVKPSHRASTTLPAGKAVPRNPDMPVGIPGSWKLKLDATFTGAALDTNIWQAGWFGTGVTPSVNPNQRACYRSSNVVVGGGYASLNITHSSAFCRSHVRPYSAALISSNPHDGRTSGGFQYTYGVAQARIDVTTKSGTVENWPAFWTDGQNWPKTGEIDMFEGIGGGVCFNFHSPQPHQRKCITGNYSGWNTYASVWKPGSITYYYNGQRVGALTNGVTDAPMYLVLVNTVGPISWRHTVTPASMKVSYVKVWQH